MKIHHILRQVTEPGTLLTYQEIKQKVRDAYPDIKSRSIVPSEHTRGKKGVCKLCHDWPVFEKLEHGLYQVLPGPEQVDELSVHDKLVQALAACLGQQLTVGEIRGRVAALFPDTHLPSVIPLDHTQGGACRICVNTPLLERTAKRGCYRVLAPPQPVALPLALLSPDQLSRIGDLLMQFKPDILHAQPEGFLKALAALADLDYRELNLLAHALRERVVIDLLEFSPLLESEVLHARLAQRLYENQGISPPLARWAVEVWHTALAGGQAGIYAAVRQPEGYSFGESGLKWSGLRAAGIQLLALQTMALSAEISWLKKQRHRVALLAYPDTHRLLGVRPKLVPAGLSELARLMPVEALPVQLPLSPHELEGYRWYQFSDSESLKKGLTLLDQSFGLTADKKTKI